MHGEMSSSLSIKTVVLLFVAVLAAYCAVFLGIERTRTHKGPWEAEFQHDPQGLPTLSISQTNLGLSGVRIVFHGESVTNEGGRVLFDRVKQPAPFGQVIYEDLTFLPGVVTFDLFGHEIEVLPRVLIVNKRQVPWQSGLTIDLWPTNKPAEPPHPPRIESRYKKSESR